MAPAAPALSGILWRSVGALPQKSGAAARRQRFQPSADPECVFAPRRRLDNVWSVAEVAICHLSVTQRRLLDPDTFTTRGSRMTRLTKKWAVGGVALGALLSATSAGFAASSASSIDARLRMLEAEIAKLRQGSRSGEIRSRGRGARRQQGDQCRQRRAMARVPTRLRRRRRSLSRGPRQGPRRRDRGQEHSHQDRRPHPIDGGGTAGSPGNAWQGNAGFSQARMEIEGRTKPWFFKLQYDFANYDGSALEHNLSNAAIFGNGTGGAGATPSSFRREAMSPTATSSGAASATPISACKIRACQRRGWPSRSISRSATSYESFSLEAIASSKYRDTIERPMAVDAIAPSRHLGAGSACSARTTGPAHLGLYSLSLQDLNTRPVNTSSGKAGVIVPVVARRAKKQLVSALGRRRLLGSHRPRDLGADLRRASSRAYRRRGKLSSAEQRDRL